MQRAHDGPDRQSWSDVLSKNVEEGGGGTLDASLCQRGGSIGSTGTQSTNIKGDSRPHCPRRPKPRNHRAFLQGVVPSVHRPRAVHGTVAPLPFGLVSRSSSVRTA